MYMMANGKRGQCNNVTHNLLLSSVAIILSNLTDNLVCHIL